MSAKTPEAIERARTWQRTYAVPPDVRVGRRPNDHERRVIAELRRLGWSAEALARAYGMSARTVYRYCGVDKFGG